MCYVEMTILNSMKNASYRHISYWLGENIEFYSRSVESFFLFSIFSNALFNKFVRNTGLYEFVFKGSKLGFSMRIMMAFFHRHGN